MKNIKDGEIIEPEVITEVDEIKNNALATMHNRFVEARYKLTVEEQRIMLALISLIQPDDEDFKDYKIPVSVLKELTGTKRKDIYSAVKEAVERLLKRTIKIETEEGFEAFNFISYGRYKRGEGYFIVSIDKHLKPYLLQLKERFTSIPLKYIFPLRSTYSIRLYELLKQYESTGFRVDYLPELREMLGIEPNEYPRFDNFERKILKVAIKEINEKTDLEVSYTKKKTGRKITHIEFEIKPKRRVDISNEGYTTKSEKTSSQTIDTQGLVKGLSKESKKEEKTEENHSKKFDLDEFWNEVKEYRKKYWDVLEKYNEWKEETKRTHKDKKFIKERLLPENSVLFLLINAEENGYPPEMVLKAIRKTVLDKNVKNPMGFLINFFDIDVLTANLIKLTGIEETPDKEVILAEKEKEEQLTELKEMVKNKEIFEKFKTKIKKEFVDFYITSEIPDFKTLGELGDYLIRMLTNAVIDKEGKIIYVPAQNERLLDWFEVNFKEHFENFVREKAKRDYIVKPVLFDVKLLKE